MCSAAAKAEKHFAQERIDRVSEQKKPSIEKAVKSWENIIGEIEFWDVEQTRAFRMNPWNGLREARRAGTLGDIRRGERDRDGGAVTRAWTGTTYRFCAQARPATPS